jgi:hypothetical protein
VTEGPTPREARELAPGRRVARSASRPVLDVPTYTASEVAHGQTAAVLGALGRMQLQVDVLNRQLSDAVTQLESKLDEVLACLRSEDIVGTADGPASPGGGATSTTW